MSLFTKLLVLLILTGTLPIQALPSNLEIFTDLVKSVYSEEFDNLDFDDNAVVVIKENQDTNEFRKILYAELKKWCEKKEFELYTSRFSVPEKLQSFIYVFDFTPVQNNVVYQTKKEELNGNVSRSVHVQLLMKIEKSGQILYNKKVAKDYSDNVRVDQYEQIETDFFSFTKGKRGQSLINRLFEPVLVSVATGTIIYLFYNFRSN